MKLIDLDPRWVSGEVFVFLCPHCQDVLLSVKIAPLSLKDQGELFSLVFGKWEGWVIPSIPDAAWRISGKEFSRMTIFPNLDARDTGHWVGRVEDGETHTEEPQG